MQIIKLHWYFLYILRFTWGRYSLLQVLSSWGIWKQWSPKETIRHVHMSAYLFFVMWATHQESCAMCPRANHDFCVLRHSSWAKEFENWNLGRGWLTGKYNHLRISRTMFSLSLANTFALTKQNILCFFSQVRTIHPSDYKVAEDFSSHSQTF